ncbi:S8 family peptidase [Piscinibacter gummiphilus]|jgi:hypothetical protein|uniref:S8 family peptidase n=1 Tax=Piscinibacter gummiphilus TaxID=946333 RepID=A0ABZ0CMX7_9BURK|nr:S8 family peptidase [Piscinibacter gummiphilus]WOB05871.1 S8 family peptidase [Piscinibacter gummiphilus]
MATRYIIAKGELLTYPIGAPKKEPGEKNHPYTLAQAKAALLPQIDEATHEFDRLPPQACPGDIAVALVTLHPAYLAKSYFPRQLLQTAGLESLGSRSERIRPRRVTRANAPPEADTTQLFVAGRRSAMRAFRDFAAHLTEGSREAAEFAQIEDFQALTADNRVRGAADLERIPSRQGVFEVGLHVPSVATTDRLREVFAAFAKTCGFELNPHFRFDAGRLLFVPVEGDADRLQELAQFSLMRVVRPMPKLRAARPMLRTSPVAVPFRLPEGDVLSREPRVAVLDGGLPQTHILDRFVRRYFEADEDADPVDEYLAHGLGVTSALLFGPIPPGGQAPRPFAAVDHHRVLDSVSDTEDPYDLYRTLGHIETILISRTYQFVNLSMGPDLCVEDHEVHAWTAVIDEILSDGNTLLSVAVGNNGTADAAARLNRIQVPADSVNALAVGAADRSSAGWERADYSAIGPGRSPGRRKPDVVAFGGSGHEYFHVVAPGARPDLSATLGTSFAAPLALRAAVGIRAVLGSDLFPLTTKALLIHGCEASVFDGTESVGWGKVPTDVMDLITSDDGAARIIYQGELRPGKFLRMPVPLPLAPLAGMVTLTATFCYACPVDPQDASAYTKAGLAITFRPHADKRKDGAAHANTYSFFPSNEWRTEAEQRADLNKWETVLHSSHTFRGSSLKGSVFDVHYNARDSGAPATGAERIPYALVITVHAPRHLDLHQQILQAHAVLETLQPAVNLQLDT